MPDKDGKFYNSWDMAKSPQGHGMVWLATGGGYRNGTHCKWLLYAPRGKQFKPEPGVDEKLPYNHSGPKTGWAHCFPTFDEAAEWAKEHYGVTGWKKDRWGGYHPSTTHNDRACANSRFGDACSNKRKPGETLCGVHLNVVKRDREWKQKWAEASERRHRDDQLSRDCREAAEKLAIPVGKGHHVSMHAEDFLALCRELTELRELREFA